jgi:hypothetical protein
MKSFYLVIGLIGLTSGLAFERSAAPVFAGNQNGNWGTVKGQIILDADVVPEPVKINVDKDQNHCLNKGPLFRDDKVINPKNKGIQWTFVWLAPEGKGAPLKNQIHPDLQQIKNKQVTIDQPHCQFEPHALGMREGQDLVAKNSAPIAHNVHWQGHPLKNPAGNVIVPAGGQHVIPDLVADRFPVKVNCDIHAWMGAWVRVFDHPYYAVTDKDGKFEIKLAPAGKFRLVTWHEAKGWGPGGKEGIPVEIKANGVTSVGDIKLDLKD